jgi:hypothetical protein
MEVKLNFNLQFFKINRKNMIHFKVIRWRIQSHQPDDEAGF